MVHFVSQFKHFLLGRRFQVRTDNSAVRYWTKIHAYSYDPQEQTAGWLVRLAAFDFEIKHRAGRQHNNAYGMSRLHLFANKGGKGTWLKQAIEKVPGWRLPTMVVMALG